MKVLVISSRDLEKGSTKFRIAQYADYLASKDIHLEYIKRTDIDKTILQGLGEYDLVFNQKCLFRQSLARKIITYSKKSLFDFDDAIYTRPGAPHSWITSMRVKRRLHYWLKQADIVTTANQYLADYARRYSANVQVVPMAVDMDLWRPIDIIEKANVVVGWAGSPVNVKYLERMDALLCRLVEKYPFVTLAVYSGKKPKLTCPFRYTPYSPGSEAEFIQSLDIGLLPLAREEYAKGKSPIKAIQYLACAVPVVGNVFGATTEILDHANSIAVQTDAEWLAGLSKLVDNRTLRVAMGNAGREFVLKHHALTSVRQRLAAILSGNIQ